MKIHCDLSMTLYLSHWLTHNVPWCSCAACNQSFRTPQTVCLMLSNPYLFALNWAESKHAAANRVDAGARRTHLAENVRGVGKHSENTMHMNPANILQQCFSVVYFFQTWLNLHTASRGPPPLLRSLDVMPSAFLHNQRCVCVCVYMYLLHSEEQSKILTGRVRFLQSEDVLADPHNFKGLFLRVRLEV